MILHITQSKMKRNKELHSMKRKSVFYLEIVQHLQGTPKRSKNIQTPIP